MSFLRNCVSHDEYALIFDMKRLRVRYTKGTHPNYNKTKYYIYIENYLSCRCDSSPRKKSTPAKERRAGGIQLKKLQL